ncbi:unnamed protein product, partial [marine sediment metagenome]
MGLFDRLSLWSPAGAGVLATKGRTTKDDHKIRILRQHEYWNFYNGKHWQYPKEENVPQVTLNYCRAFVNKSVAF